MEVVSDAPAAPPGPRAADPKMNWAAIHALVQEIPKTFRDPSFSNSGRQISRVVTASDPARELEQVKAWQTSLEGIVDELVGTHHGSLSRSIKNYAEIVQLFEVNRANVDTTRAVLNEGRARLVSETNATAEKVRETWRRTLVNREVARKLADLERLTRLPGTARACVAAGDFENAVALIERASAMLRAPAARDARAALADVRRECAATETSRTPRWRGKSATSSSAAMRRAGETPRTWEDRERYARYAPTRRWKKTRRHWRRSRLTSRRETRRARAVVARLVGCAARLGAPRLARAMEGLRRSVAGEIWTLLAEQIAHGAERADDLEAAARREASREDDEKAPSEKRLPTPPTKKTSTPTTSSPTASSRRTLHAPLHTRRASWASWPRMCARSRAPCSPTCAPWTPSSRESSARRLKPREASRVSRARRFARRFPGARGLARAPRLCEGLEGLEGLGVRASARARDTRAWWHAHDETPRRLF